MSTSMTRLPASATAGDRQQVQNLPEDDSANSSSNDSLLEVKQSSKDTTTATYRHGPSREGDQGWSDGFSFNGGPDWIRFAPLSIPSHRRLQTAAVLAFPLLLPITVAIFFLSW